MSIQFISTGQLGRAKLTIYNQVHVLPLNMLENVIFPAALMAAFNTPPHLHIFHRTQIFFHFGQNGSVQVKI